MLCGLSQRNKELILRPFPLHVAALLTALLLAGASCQRSAPSAEQTAATRLEERELELTVDGMHCETCPLTVKTAAKAVRGVLDVKVTTDPGRARVRYQPAQTTPAAIADAITESGYPAQQVAP